MTLQKGHKADLVKKGAVLWLVYFIHHAAQFIYKKTKIVSPIRNSSSINR